jgi:glycosyltransferase involved in cell wall biosynthesis
VKAVKLLVDRSYDIHFHILGDGPLAEPIRALVRSLGLEHRIHFEGRVPAPTVASFLRKADVYLATAHSDGASASLFEAMACGAFPVVTDIPANREWIKHGINGLLFRAGDVEATAEAIAHALGSPRLRAQAADANGLIAREHLILKRNVGLMVDRFLELRSGQRPPVPE